LTLNIQTLSKKEGFIIMKKKVFSILVDNTSGALSRVSGLFSRRGFNIDSLTVGETENPKYSRMTVVAKGDDISLDQIEKQLAKLEDVREVRELLDKKSSLPGTGADYRRRHTGGASGACIRCGYFPCQYR
jgi:acetolactate synthase regulatory subunit